MTDVTTEKISKIIKSYLKNSNDYYVDVSLSGISDNIHIIVVSRFFDDMKEKQKHDYIWDLIENSDLNREERLRISMVNVMSPDEIISEFNSRAWKKEDD